MRDISDLENLFDEWRVHLGPAENLFVSDGPIEWSTWMRSELKVLFLLKEPHDRNSVIPACGFDLRVLFREPERFHQNRKTVERQMVCWADDLRAVHGLSSLGAPQAIRSCAVMNLKKVAGGAASSDAEIRKCAIQDRPFIKRQIEILAPDVVVCGGTARVLSNVFPSLDRMRGELCFRNEDSWWLDHYHPAAWAHLKHRHSLVLNAYAEAVGSKRLLHLAASSRVR